MADLPLTERAMFKVLTIKRVKLQQSATLGRFCEPLYRQWNLLGVLCSAYRLQFTPAGHLTVGRWTEAGAMAQISIVRVQ